MQSKKYSINELLDVFKISDLKNEIFSSLSQGQMQLVSIVRGFSSGPKVLLLDEVFSSLDAKNKKILSSYLSELILKEEVLIILTSHEEDHHDLQLKELCLS